MTLPEVLDYHRARCRKPSVWIVFLVLWLSEALVRWSAGDPAHVASPRFWAYALAVPFLLFAGFAWLTPWAWLWTGRSGSFPSLLRGSVQSWILGTCSFLLVTGLDWYTQGSASMRMTYVQDIGWGVLLVEPVIFGAIGFATVALDKANLARSEAEQRAQEAQWILLRGQMNPHVFFNAMNNLTELIRKDPVKAEGAAVDLSGLFRRLMDHGQNPLAPLREERELVASYLNIEALRLDARLQVEWAWDAALDEVHAPPFLIQPLVENAIKHGLSPHPDGGRLRIEGRLEGSRARIRVANTGRLLRGRNTDGKGLPNLEARLRLAFDAEAAFSLVEREGWTVAELSFPVLQEAL